MLCWGISQVRRAFLYGNMSLLLEIAVKSYRILGQRMLEVFPLVASKRKLVGDEKKQIKRGLVTLATLFR